MHNPAAAEISVESDGIRLTLRVESSAEDYSRPNEGPQPGVEAREFADLVHRSLYAGLPSLLQARDLVAASLALSYIALLDKQIESLRPRQKLTPRRMRK